MQIRPGKSVAVKTSFEVKEVGAFMALQPMNTERMQLSLAADSSQRRVYAVGGIVNAPLKKKMDAVERYERVTNKWRRMAGLREVGRTPGVCVFGRTLFCFSNSALREQKGLHRLSGGAVRAHW